MNRETFGVHAVPARGALWTAGAALAAFLFLFSAVPWPRVAVADPVAAGQSGGQTITGNTVRTRNLVILPAVNVSQVANVQITPSQPGANDYWYWVVSRNSAGQVSAPAGSFAVLNVAAPSPASPITVSWTPVSGVASYDLLRTSAGTTPSGNCGCEVAGGTASTQVTDALATTSAYAVSPGGVSITVTSQQNGGAQSLLFQIGQAAAQSFAVLPISLTSGVTGTLPVANGGTGTATPGLVAGANITITGAWPNQTISGTASGGGATILQVSSDATCTGTTPCNVAGMSMSVSAGTFYRGVCQFIGQSNQTSSSAQAVWSAPSATVSFWAPSGSQQTENPITTQMSYSASTALQITSAPFVYQPSAAGTLQLQIRDTATATTATLKSGSWCAVQ